MERVLILLLRILRELSVEWCALLLLAGAMVVLWFLDALEKERKK
jgi:hypothetical protein